MKKVSWKKLSSKYVLQNPWYGVRQDEVIRPDGSVGIFNVVECGKSVFILPITEEGKILLVHLYRYPTQRFGWELPAGSIDGDETPLQAAKRELQEETGRKAAQWESVGTFDSMNGMTDAIGHVYVARGLSATPTNEKIEEGITRVKAFTIKEILTMIAEEKIVDALTIASLMRAQVTTSLIDVEAA